MAERHGNSISIRASNLSQGYDTTGNGVTTSAAKQWRESSNGRPEGIGYQWRNQDAGREREVADQVAAAQAEAKRRARGRRRP